jgi:hypothetical protein
MKTYLSIDLDFWTSTYDAQHALEYIFDKVVVGDIPWKVVVDHEGLVRHTQQFQFDKLVNIDEHSDVVEDDGPRYAPEFTCGTWLNFVSYRKQRELVWVHPSRTLRGRCDTADSRVPFNKLGLGWKKQRHLWSPKTEWKNELEWDDVVGVGIALSPDFTDTDVLGMFITMMHSYRRLKAVQMRY